MNRLEIALTALRDIAGGMNSASPSNAMLKLQPGEFHKMFVPLLQKVAREAIAKITTTCPRCDEIRDIERPEGCRDPDCPILADAAS